MVGAAVCTVDPLIEVSVRVFLAPNPISAVPVTFSPTAKPFLIFVICTSRTVVESFTPA